MVAKSRSAARSRDAAGERVAAWTQGYAPLAGTPDEFIGRDGQARPHWRHLLNALAGLDPGRDRAALRRRPTSGSARSGMSYRVQGETAERSWPLSRMPLLIPEAEWREIAQGVAQRAELFERVLGDIYGPGALVGDGVLPAAAITGSRGFSRRDARRRSAGRPLAAASTPPTSAAAPTGAGGCSAIARRRLPGSGYALENRLVVLAGVSQPLQRDERPAAGAVLPRIPRRAAGERASAREPRICILTPGPCSADLFRAGLSRPLPRLPAGRGRRPRDARRPRLRPHHRRTEARRRHLAPCRRRLVRSAGTERRLAHRRARPDRGDPRRRRRGRNMPGSGLLESRALLAFLPGARRRLLGEDLLMPNIATWWCGQAGEREQVLDATRRRSAIAGAFGDRLAGLRQAAQPRRRRPVGGRARRGCARRSRRAASISSARTSCGSRRRRAGRTDGWSPRPFVLRVYAAATPDGWRVMPGGFCRISDRPDARAVSMGEGVESADVWVLADKPVEASTLLPTPEKVRIVRLLGNLPSRAADNLFWFGRYLEREEATLRLVRCLCAGAIDPDAPCDGARQSLERLKGLLVAWGAVMRRPSPRIRRPRRARGAARPGGDRLGAVDRAGGAPRRLGHPRAADARDLAADRPAGERSSSRRRRRALSEPRSSIAPTTR